MNVATNNDFEDANFGFLHKIVPKTTKTSVNVNNINEMHGFKANKGQFSPH